MAAGIKNAVRFRGIHRIASFRAGSGDWLFPGQAQDSLRLRDARTL
ncbi:hypothetical protein CHK_0106 [Christensenella hongkongensis]|uniref:Uncharacterized protein n=1 Tax=Christensenella hongkongensis TaxID=270498 RepID=A0A0M2NPP9_9FIRM|nr:hypothetical protein CHK_0106 [Christensenella hongkongensis]